MKSIVVKVLFTCIVTAVIAFMFTPEAGANYADTCGMSARGIARGNAMSAVVYDWSSVYYNVAGLGRTRLAVDKGENSSEMNLKLKDKKDEKESNEKDGEKPKDYYPSQFGVNYLLTFPQLSLQLPKIVSTTKNQEFGVIGVGLALDLNYIFKMPDFVSSIRVGVSLGLMQDGSLVKMNDLDPANHQFMQYGRNAQRTVILGGLGIGFLKDAFGIGGGANILLGGKGKISLLEVMALSDRLQMPIQNVQLDVTTKVAPTAGIYISPGRLWSPLEGLTIAGSYRGRVMVVIPMYTFAKVDTLGLELNMLLKVNAFFTPHVFTGGIAWTLPWAPITLSVDVDYQMWSQYWFKNNTLGVYMERPKFVDIIVPRAGINYMFIKYMGISVGYYYQPTYIPKSALMGDINTMDNTKHVLSGGLEFVVPRLWRMMGDVHINLGYQYQMLVSRTVIKMPNLLRSGTQALNPSYKYGGKVHAVTAEIAFRW